MIKKFKEYTDAQKTEWGKAKNMAEYITYESFSLQKSGICAILCDQKSLNNGHIMDAVNKLSKNKIDEFYVFGNISVKGINVKPVDNEFIRALSTGELLDSKIVVFIQNDLETHWNDDVKKILVYSNYVIKTNTIKYNDDASDSAINDINKEEEEEKNKNDISIENQENTEINTASDEFTEDKVMDIANKYLSLSKFKSLEPDAWEWAKKHGMERKLIDYFL